MKKARILLILGIWVSVLSYLGFRTSWKDIMFTITGFILILMSYSVYREYKIKKITLKKQNFDSFSENKNFSENTINTDENNFN